MPWLAVQSLTPAVRAWLRDARHARILHIFDHAVNLIAGTGVLSLVTPAIGNGPFNVVLPPFNFVQHITPSSLLRITSNTLHIGGLVIDLSPAALWIPYPDWHQLRSQHVRLQTQVPVLRAVLQQHAPANSLAHIVVELPAPLSSLETQIVKAAHQHWDAMCQGALCLDYARCAAGARQLVGLGGGLTPAGDDWLLGCALAAHLDLPLDLPHPALTRCLRAG
jgi:hypothetical protein